MKITFRHMTGSCFHIFGVMARAAVIALVVPLCACTENKRLATEIKDVNAKTEHLNVEIGPLAQENTSLTELIAVAHSNMRYDSKGAVQSGEKIETELSALREQESALRTSLDNLRKDFEGYRKRFPGN